MNRETLIRLLTIAGLIWSSLGSSGTLAWGPCAAPVMYDAGSALPCTGLLLDVPTHVGSTALTAKLQTCSGA